MNNIGNEKIAKAGFPDAHALVIAIAAYSKVSRLPDVVINDAHEINNTLTSPVYCGYDRQNVVLLLNDQATLDSINHELNSLASRTKSDDTVFIYFSGHGANIGSSTDPISALVPVDCNPADILSTSLLEESLSDALMQIKAKRLIVCIDACHAGGAGTLKASDGNSVPNLSFSEKSLAKLAQGTGRVLIASSRASETSLILSGASNSLFTEHLVKALRGGAHTQGDGLIRIFDVFNYVSEKVKGAAPGMQHPIFKASDLEDNFPVALDRGGIKDLSSTSGVSSNNVTVSKQLEDILSDLYPVGPQDQEIWARAGGDISRLKLSGTGRSNWFSALKIMRQGGGGNGINQKSLIRTALQDFPHHNELGKLI
jgi:metacaspase-1